MGAAFAAADAVCATCALLDHEADTDADVPLSAAMQGSSFIDDFPLRTALGNCRGWRVPHYYGNAALNPLFDQ